MEAQGAAGMAREQIQIHRCPARRQNRIRERPQYHTAAHWSKDTTIFSNGHAHDEKPSHLDLDLLHIVELSVLLVRVVIIHANHDQALAIIGVVLVPVGLRWEQ